ncbi:hypothetical protein GC194_05700 [bacterium]|nr:hypothetical protein [bacterium]
MIRYILLAVATAGLTALANDGKKILIGKHDDLVNTLCYSLDGSMFASGSNDNKITIWDLNNQKPKKSFVAHSVGVSDLVFTPNSKYLISAGLDNLIRVWDTETWKMHKELNGHSAELAALAVTRNGQYLFSGGDDKKIVVWNLEDFSKVTELAGHFDRVLSLATSENGKYLVSTGGDRMTLSTGNLKVWKIDDWSLTYNLEEETYAIQDAELSAAGTLVLYAGNFPDAYFLKWTENKLAAKMKVTDFGINALALDGLQCYLGSSFKGDLISWKIGGEKVVYENHNHDINAIALSPDKESIVTAGVDGNLIMRKLH